MTDSKKKRGRKITQRVSEEKLSEAAEQLVAPRQTRWIENRIKDRGIKAMRVSQITGIPYWRFRRLINDPRTHASTQKLEIPDLLSIAKLLDISIEECAYRLGFSVGFTAETKVNCVGVINPDGTITYWPDQNLVDVPAPRGTALETATVVALRANMHKTPLELFDNAIFYYDAREMELPRAESRRRLSVVKFHKRRPDMIGYLTPQPNDFVSLLAFGSAMPEVIAASDIKGAARISWIHNL